MDIRQLEYAIVLGETLHFGQAAQRMHIAQSAFSTQIARLERQVGAPLFDRSANRVSLTTAGETFLPRARRILADVAEASLEARAVTAASETHLRVGLFCESAGELTPLIISAYRRAMPGVVLTFRELSMVEQVEALANDVVDVEFIRPPVADSRVALHALFAEPRVAVVPPDHELAELTTVPTDLLLGQPFAVAAPEAPAKWRAYWSCDDERGEPGRVAAYVTSVQESLNAIAYAGAVDTFPMSASRFLTFPGVAYRSLEGGGYSVVAIAARRTDARPHVDAFIRLAQHLARTALPVVPGAVSIADAPPGTPHTA